MRDRVFPGRDVAEALGLAGRALGLPAVALRYVVLEPGSEAGPGRPAREARIAVLMDATASARPRPGETPAAEPGAGIENIVRALSAAAGSDLKVEVREDEETFLMNLRGEGSALLLADGGAALRALQHLLQRIYGRALAPRRLALDCEGHREQRREALGREARELAAAVRADGVPRQTEALNAYERRLIHLALSDAPGVRTFSVGEGSDRRVTIAPAVPGADSRQGTA